MKLKVFVLVLLLSSTSMFAQSKDDESLKSLVKQMTDAQTNFQPEILDWIFTADYIEISPIGDSICVKKFSDFINPNLNRLSKKHRSC